MTMIALVFKILIIIMMMMMMMTIVVMGKKDNHKDDNTRKGQKYNDDDRKRKIFKNSWPGKIVWVLGWTLRLLNQAIYKACHVTSILYVARIIIANVLCISVSLRFCCCLFFSLSLLGEESPIFWIWDSLHIHWYKNEFDVTQYLKCKSSVCSFARLNDRHQYLSNCHLPLP